MKVAFADAANLAITEEWDYYNDQQGPELADRWEAAVAAAVNSLCESPDRGSRCRLPFPALSDLRWIPIKGFPFRIFYIFERSVERLTVVHVIHNKREIADLLEFALQDQ